MKRHLVVVFAVVLVAALARSVIRLPAANPPKIIEPLPESEVEFSFDLDGTKCKLVRGDVYQIDPKTGKWKFLQALYDPAFYEKNYAEKDGKIFRKDSGGTLIPVRYDFTEDFENAASIRDLIGLERGWTTFTLQSPKTPQIKDYVALKKKIEQGQSGFIDNRVEPSTEMARSGRSSLKTYSVPNSRSMVTAKASLSTELLHFVKGDDVWFSGWYYVSEGSPIPSTLMDLETTWMEGHPGIRIMVSGGKYLVFELKWATKIVYRQPRGKEINFPTGKWVHVKAHLKLSEKDDGVIELWQDGVKIVDARGQTLLLPHTIYNSFEVGISAFTDGSKPATLFVDDLRISNKPLE